MFCIIYFRGQQWNCYDFRFKDKYGYPHIIGGISRLFDMEFWNYAKLISGILRYGMPLENVIALISSLQLDSDNMNTWVSGVAKALKRYIVQNNPEGENTQSLEDIDD